VHCKRGKGVIRFNGAQRFPGVRSTTAGEIGFWQRESVRRLAASQGRVRILRGTLRRWCQGM